MSIMRTITLDFIDFINTLYLLLNGCETIRRVGFAVTGTFGRDSPCCLSDVGLVAESSEAFTD